MGKKNITKNDNNNTIIVVVSFFASIIGIIFYFSNFYILQKEDVKINKTQGVNIIKNKDRIHEIEKSILKRDVSRNKIYNKINIIERRVDKLEKLEEGAHEQVK